MLVYYIISFCIYIYIHTHCIALYFTALYFIGLYYIISVCDSILYVVILYFLFFDDIFHITYVLIF